MVPRQFGGWSDGRAAGDLRRRQGRDSARQDTTRAVHGARRGGSNTGVYLIGISIEGRNRRRTYDGHEYG